MKVIVIRGLPGVGKTVVSEILEEIFEAEVIHVDNFKLKEMKSGKSVEKSREIAYEQALKKLYLLYKKNRDYIILEEIIHEKDFLGKLYKFVNETMSQAYWFRLMRPIEKLLEVESNRKRRIKNTKEDLFKLKQDIESCKIKGECWIKNDNLALTIKKILEVII